MAVLALCGIEAALLLDDPPSWVLVLFPVAALTWFAAGAVATLRRPGNRMGAIMIAGALVWIGAGLSNVAYPSLAAVGVVVATLPLGLVVHLLHAFPSGRLRGRASRAIVAGVYAAALLLHAPIYLFLPDGFGAPLQLADRPDLARLGLNVQEAIGGGLLIATAFVLAARLRAATPPQRRVLAPLSVCGIAVVVLVPLLSHLRGPLLGDDPFALFAAQAVLLSLVPVAFTSAVLRGGFAPTAGVQELSAWLGAAAADGERATLRNALADALGDPSVELVLWAGERDGWLDPHGRPFPLPDPRSGRAVVTVEAEERRSRAGEAVAAGEERRVGVSGEPSRHGVAAAPASRRIGAIVYDAGLIADAAPVREAARVIALALDRERLTAQLIASREGLRRSRARIAAAADDERRRIARDLHDGMQGRLVLLAMRANELARGTDGSASARADADADADALRGELDTARSEADALRAELESALGTLRELVHGVLPAALVERGLGAAADELADRMPIPTTVHAGDERFPPAVESAGWFVIAESLANAVKYAHARTLGVRVERTAVGLRVEVRDDGVGGAGASGGTGLRGLADRVDVLGGRLTVDSPAHDGTRVVAEVPCAS
ncbi:histidine kinase [Conexibacter sp. CPCC 206217]|uniref:sensor histidine kinase n=1 Tax=Conexibacter sp. CPCC 206217 TaxID=3064574 RepID=UPI002728B734|nr:histidine kinase [Conexibacter sp. CPCC 206217]MDO8212337.1 histidine kinase [Conexibacter sp. CPCC 206217]